MRIGAIFWIVWLIVLLLGLWQWHGAGVLYLGGGLVTWFLLGLLGWAAFGASVQK